MNIVLINPPSPKGYTANRGFMGGYGMLHFDGAGGTVLPPHQLLLFAGIVKGRADIRLIDAVAKRMSLEAVVGELATLSPDIVFIEVSTPTADSDYLLASAVKQKFSVPVVLMGPHPAHTAPEAFRKSGCDAILKGVVPSVLERLLSEGTGVFPGGIAGTIVRNGDGARDCGTVTFTADELPFPDWTIAPLDKYFYLFQDEQPFATMVSSYGCVFRCKFCPYPVAQDFTYCEMSAGRVYKEMEYLKGLGVKMILFRDALFSANKKRVSGLCDLLAERPLGLRWRCETSVDSVDDELLAKMARNGCVGINFGIESLESGVADEMDCGRKRRDLARVKQVFRRCSALGIQTFAFFVHGLPGDSETTIRKNVRFAVELGPDHVQFTFATPYPGTELYDIVSREGLLQPEPWERFSSLSPVMATRYLSKDQIRLLNQWAYRRFFVRPGRILRELRDPRRLARKIKAYLAWVRK